ncbi:hypothetical protein HF995_05885 [Sanguibacter hominis ATCC BAA-789]|uniref:Restriction endonuclease n=1 Tax=Sanguibacter hominis ATCC BAA-789 TaxID=1312740 RepID=A0A9X5FF18_9MICO|nr:hypothetical protein [Sanguibacter hominis]NKX92806.1 hypothetical protein [Sanguibacter hominis ATCC BAA-789]
MADEKSSRKPSAKALAWPLFDRIVADGLNEWGTYTNPWIRHEDGSLHYQPDYPTLQRLLGVPLHLRAETTTGVPALAIDVWIAYELRRAGFAPDVVWPRATHPRIMPSAITALLDALPKGQAADLRERLAKEGHVRGVSQASASILGKNYRKQVDVIIADWSTGPELLISTKRMDSSYGKNAPNRVEESYGDAKNLRLRHPLAALGFAFGLRNDVFDREPLAAEWLLDLLGKMGREDDAYHATCVILMEYGKDVPALPDTGGDEERRAAAAGLEGPPPDDEPVEVTESEMDRTLAQLPWVRIDHNRTPQNLSPATFLAAMANHVLETTPINMHVAARRTRFEAAASDEANALPGAHRHNGDTR